MRIYTVAIAFFILIFGVLSSVVLASIAPHEATGQVMYMVVGLALYGLLQIPLPGFYQRMAPILFGVVCVGLLITLVIGRVSHGAMRWLPLGPIHIQVSEVAKPVMALILAWYVMRYPLSTQRRVIGFLVLMSLLFLPTFLQPDLGSALVIAATALTILFVSVGKVRLLVPWIVTGVVSILFAWHFIFYDYQKERITSFLSNQASGPGYNAAQSLIAVGSGKLFGRGLGHGVQSGLRFLPEFHTDFIFASLAEELGFVGVVSIILLYLTLFLLLLQIWRKGNLFARIYGVGFIGALFFQMAVHIGMNMRLFPITGIPLPLLSSGGSSFLSLCIGLGLFMRLTNTRSTVY